jgi:hypothetical protein
VKFFYKLILPKWVLGLSVMGWDDLLVMAIGSAMTAGAQAATRPDVNSTQYGDVPSNAGGQEDPFAWVNSILQQRDSRQSQINQS